MRDYELTLVLDPEVSGEKQKKFLAKIKKAVEGLKGKVQETHDWGRKELAYPIKKRNLGLYFLWEIKLPEKGPQELDRKLKLEGDLLRYLLVRKE